MVDASVILVVDDNAAIRDNVVELLADEGYVVWSAGTADAALARLDREACAPAVVLLDLVMPGMLAGDFAARLRQSVRWASSRIVVMTAASDRMIPPDLPFDAVLAKPFDVEDLLRHVADAASPRAPHTAAP